MKVETQISPVAPFKLSVFMAHQEPHKTTGSRSDLLTIENKCIVYSAGEYRFSLPVSELKVLGEYTTENGPADDWFYVFVTGDGKWQEATVYAGVKTEFMNQLNQSMGTSLCGGLTNSTSLRSNIIWPADLSRKPLFEFKRETRSPLLNPIKWLLEIVAPRYQFILTDKVLEYLQSLAK